MDGPAAEVETAEAREAPRPRGPVEAVFVGPHGIRAGWRIALYVVFTAAFGIVFGTLGAGVGLDPNSLWGAGLVALVASVAAGWMMLGLLDRRGPGALGFALEPAAARDSALGLSAGAGFLLAAVALLAVAGTARWVADEGTAAEYVAALGAALVFFAIPAAMEEAVFRGYAFQALVQGIGAWPAVLLSSALFAAGHLANPNVNALAVANIFLAGVMLAVAYLRTRSLWFATAVHLGWNWAMSAVADFPVSGLTGRDTPLYTGVETGADWWTGGVFGPEAGLAATVMIVAATVWLMRTPLIGESAKMRSLRPLVDDRIGARWPAAGRGAE